jgi:hypothetical protein
MASTTPTSPDARPRFADGQVLTADDLTAEQTYLIAARRRHLLSGHTPGIVTGLEPSLQDGVVTVSPGLAVDGDGRELVLTTASVPRAQTGAPGPAGDVGIYLQYSLVSTAAADPAHPRWSEQADLFTAPLSTEAPPVSDVTALPDDTTAPAWPVLLGVVKAGNAGLDLTVRRSAGAIGSALSAPQATSRVDFSRTGGVAVTVGSGTEPALTIDAGGTTVPGNAVVGGSLTVGLAYPLALQSQPAPTAASPWSLYRAHVPATRSTPTTPGAAAFEDLRIELPAPPAGPDPTQQAVSFGAQGGGSDFARTLSVLTDGTVVINGDLHVAGRLATAPAPLDASDPRVQQALLANFVHGVQAGTQALEQQYTGRLALSGLQLQAAGGQITCTASLQNIGAVAVKSIAVTAAVWLEGTPQPAPDQTLSTAGQLDAQASLALQGTLSVPGTGTVNVLLRAVGSGLAGTTIQANDVTGSVTV